MDKNTIIKDFEKMRFLSIKDKDEKKSNLLIQETKMNYEKNKYISSLFLQNKNSRKNLKIKEKFTNAKFYDSENLILTIKKEKHTEFIIKPLYPKKNRKLFSLPFEVEDFYVIDSENILIVSNEKIDENKEKEKFKYEIESINFVDNGVGYTFNDINRLYRYEIGKKKYTLISEKYENVEEVIKEDEETFFISSVKKEVYSIENRLYKINYSDFKSQCLYKKDDLEFIYANRIDGKIIALANDQKKYGVNQNHKFYEIEDGASKLYVDNNNSIYNSINSDIRYGQSPSIIKKDEKLYYISTRDDSANIYVLEDGKINLYFDEIKVIDGFDFVNDQLYICGFKNQQMQELFVKQGEELLKLTNYSEKFKEHINSYKIESFEFENIKKLKGYIVYPDNFDKNKKYPTVLSIHGGPKTVYSDNFIYDTYYLAKNGFAVIFTNPHGSDNFDDEFADIRGKYGQTDYEDLMCFTDEAIKRYNFIDETKLSVIGGSYGGFMTNWIVGHTDRFKAAVSQRCISNWISFYSTSDIGYYFATDQNACGFDTEKLWEKSPLKYVDNVKTPILFIHSDEDYRCPLEQAIQFYTHLKLKNVKTKLIIYKGENHDLSRTGTIKSRVSRLYEITKWLEENLK